MKLKKFQVYLVVGLLILSGIIMFSSMAGAASKNDVGYIDMERLQNELPDFKRLIEFRKDTEGEINAYRGLYYQQYQKAVKELEDKSKSDKVGKSSDEQAAIEKRFQDDVKKKSDELNAQLQQKAMELGKTYSEKEKATIEKVNKIIQSVAEEKKLSLVIDKRVWFYGGTDVTQAVIDKAAKDENQTAKDEKKTDKK